MYYLDLQKLGLSGANPYFSCNRRVSERGRQCGMFQMLLYSISYFRSCTSLLNKFTKSVFYNGRGGGLTSRGPALVARASLSNELFKVVYVYSFQLLCFPFMIRFEEVFYLFSFCVEADDNVAGKS